MCIPLFLCHVVYVCADDAHGTPIMLKADELNITPEELIAEIYESHTSVFKKFNISLVPEGPLGN